MEIVVIRTLTLNKTKESNHFKNIIMIGGNYIADTIFDKTDFSKEYITGSTYDQCSFRNCDFSNCDLTDIRFLNCEFDNCDLSMSKFSGTFTDEVIFKACKLSGTAFESAPATGLSADFEECILDNAYFIEIRMPKHYFRHCKIRESHFENCDMNHVTFTECEITGTLFTRTNLEKADFSTSFGMEIDPENNRLKGAAFSLEALPGLLTRHSLNITGMLADQE